MRLSLALAVVFIAIGCTERVERDDRATFTVDRTLPFRLEFGRGSGWHGLDTIKIDQAGQVVAHRLKSDRQADVTILSWETATLQLAPEELDQIIRAVETNNLTGLHKAYHADIQDGTQWVLWIQQGDREKSVYFNNSFPREITAFAEQLDLILARAGMDTATWHPVPEQEIRQHERELWESLNR